MKSKYILGIFLLIAISCSNEELSDAYGNFESKEVIVSSESNGKLISFELEEGQTVKRNQIIGFSDTVSLSLQKQQIIAQKSAVKTKLLNVQGQIEILKTQRETLEVEEKRLKKLIEGKAATGQKLDNIKGQIAVIDAKIKSTAIQNSSIQAELDVLDSKLEQVDLQIEKAQIINPVNGTILVKYVEAKEFVNMGKPLYKIADLSKMTIRVFVSGDQLGKIKIGDKAEVLVDDSKKENKSYEGVVSWISEQAEFTPKIIQTKEERVNLVYAVKVLVENDGSLKIGMPGEINFK